MRKILLVLFCSLLLIILGGIKGFAQEGKKITEVNISGNKNVPVKDIWEVIKLRKGQTYSQTELDGDLRSIFDLNLFSSVNIDVEEQEEGVKVTFVVEEKPIVKRIDFKGNKKIGLSSLKDALTIKEKEAYDEAKIKESQEKIVTLYKDKGFADVKVETYDTDAGEGKKILTFFITEGNKIKINKVQVIGVKAFPEKKILKILKTRRKRVYKEETLTKDIEILTNYYKQKGFFKVKVNQPQITFNPERTQMTVSITMEEGLQYKIGQIKFTGNKVFSEQELNKEIVFKKDDFYNQGAYDQTLANLQLLYADKGYVFIKIEPQIQTNDETQTMDIDYQITEGELAYVGSIIINGNEQTKDYVIRREITLKEGDPLSMSRIRRSQERIYNLGFFDDLNLETRPSEKGANKLDLIFDVKEKETMNLLTLGAGYSTVDRVVGNLQVSINNLFGRAQRLTTLYEIGSRKINYEIGFFDPWFLETYTSFGASIYDTKREKEYNYMVDETHYDASGSTVTSSVEKVNWYAELKKGGDIRFGRRFGEFYSGTVSYSYEAVQLQNITSMADITSDYLRQQIEQGTMATSGITTILSRDSRDNVFDASRGSNHSISLELAGGYLGGDNQFYKTILETAWFFPTFWRFVLGLHGVVGLVGSYGKVKEIPIYERFYVGGAETVRGYDYRGEIGPPEGGRLMTYFNLEYKFPIIREKRQTILQGAIFYDAGNIWDTPRLGHYDYALKQGIGFGFRITTPVFPIRLDYGYGLNHKPGEPISQWYFTIGPVF